MRAHKILSAWIPAACLAASVVVAATAAGNEPQSKGGRQRQKFAARADAERTQPRQDPAAEVVPDEYHIGPGDVLQIDVWREPDASSPTVTVRPDGKVSIRMLGDVSVAGLSPVQLEGLLGTKYRAFIRDARVTVAVKEINSQKVYVIGEVKKEGAVKLQGPLTVLQALAEAGGLTDYAKRKKIQILRTVQGRQYAAPFDYDAVVHGEHVEQNMILLPGDTVVVPR